VHAAAARTEATEAASRMRDFIIVGNLSETVGGAMEFGED
jgi:hypothetical protein